MNGRTPLVWLGALLGACGVARAELTLDNDTWIAMERAAVGATLTPEDADRLARNRDAINLLAVQGRVPDRVFQAANAAATRTVVDRAEQSSAAAGGRMVIQAAKPGKSGGTDPGSDIDTINQNYISPLQVVIAQRAFNDAMNRSLPPGQRIEDWQRKLDVDFMANPAAMKDKDFKEVAKLNNDAYKSRDAAAYEALSRDPARPRIPPAMTTAYVAEMQAFAEKKQKTIDELRANPALARDPALQARLAVAEGQQMKYINRIATATDRAREDKGLPPISKQIARDADLASRRGPTPSPEQRANLKESGKDFQTERAQVRAGAPNLLAQAKENFEKTRADLGLPKDPPPPAVAATPPPRPLEQKTSQGRADTTFTAAADGAGNRTDGKTTTSQGWNGGYVGTRVSVTGTDGKGSVKGAGPDAMGRGVPGKDTPADPREASKTEVEKVRGYQKPSPADGATGIAGVTQDKTTITRTPTPLGTLVGTSQKTTNRETFATSAGVEVSTTRTATRTSGFNLEKELKQGAVTVDFGDKREWSVSRERRDPNAGLPPDLKTDWRKPGLNVKLWEMTTTNRYSQGRTLGDYEGRFGKGNLRAFTESQTLSVTATATDRNAKLEAVFANSQNLLDGKLEGKGSLDLGGKTRLDGASKLTGTLGHEERINASISGGLDGYKMDAGVSAFVGAKVKFEASATLDATRSWIPVSIGYKGSLEGRAGAGGDASISAQMGWGGFKIGGKAGASLGLGGGMSHSIEVDVSKATLGVNLTELAKSEAKSELLDRYRRGLANGDLVLLPGQTGDGLLRAVNTAVENAYAKGTPLPGMQDLGVQNQNPLVTLGQLKQRSAPGGPDAVLLASVERDLLSGDPARQQNARDVLRDIRAADAAGVPLPDAAGHVLANGGGPLRMNPRDGRSVLEQDLTDLNRIQGQTRPGSDESSMLDKLAIDLQHGTEVEKFNARNRLEVIRGIAHQDPDWAKPAPVNPFQDSHDQDDLARLERLKAGAKPGSPEMARLNEIERKLQSSDRDDKNSAWADLNQVQRERDGLAGDDADAADAARRAEAQAKRDDQRLAEAGGYAAPGSDEEKAVGILAGRMKNGTPAEREKAREQLDRLLEAQREHAGIREAVAQAGPDAAPPADLPPPAPGPRWSQAQLTSHNERMENLGAGYLSDLEKLQAERARARSPEERARLDAAIAKKKEDVAWVSDQIAQNDALLRDEFGVQPPAPTPEELEAERNRQAAIAATAEANEAKLGKSAMKSHDPAKVLEIFTQIDSNRAARARAQAQAGAIGQALSDEPPPTLPAGPSRWTNQGLDNDIGNMRNLQGHTQEDIDRLREAFASSRNSTERSQLLQELADKQAELDALQRRIEEDLAEKERNKRAGLGGGVDWSEGPSDGDGAGPADVTSAGGLVNDLANARAGEGIGSGSGDDGGAAVEGGVIGGDVAGNTRRDRDEFTTRDGVHKGDKDASMETGEANPLADLTNAVNSVKGVVEGVRGGLEGVRDVKDQLDELRGHDEESEPPLPPERTTEPSDPTDPPERSGEKTPPRTTGGSEPRTPEKVRRPPAGGGGGGVSKPPPVVRTGNPPTQPPPQGPSGATGYAVFLQGGNFLGAGPMENYQNRKAAFAQSGKPMDWFIQAGPFGSSQAAHKWILDNSEPGGSGGFMTGSRIYKGKTVRVRENLESYAQ